MSPNFNADYAASVSKQQWIKEHESMAGDFDLAKEWESAQPEKAKKQDVENS